RRSLLGADRLYYGPQERDYSDETAARVDEEIRRIVDHVFDETVALLGQRREILDRSARLLLEKETLDERELQVLVDTVEQPELGPAATPPVA
ncbi:cell division protein FtsH, partial [Rhizobium laguerreae]|nr:cell division protein FtsH [Rhizobium laguerreae]